MARPWHLWVIGALSLIWNAFGAVDYVMTQTENEAYLSQFTAEQLAYFQSFPTWVQATWAIAIWFSVAGSILLLLASRYAAPVFGIAFVSMVITAIHNFGLAETRMHEVAGTGAIWFSLAIFVVSLCLWLYARAMHQRGVLS